MRPGRVLPAISVSLMCLSLVLSMGPATGVAFFSETIVCGENQAYLPLVMKSITTTQPEQFPNCRYGVTAWGPSQFQWLPALKIGWYLDFGAHAPDGPDSIEFVQVIRVKQNKSDCNYLPGYSISPSLSVLGGLVQSYPGSLWLVGNEPDRGPNPGDCANRVQDDTYPEVYAEAYHEVYQFIKQRDPTAQVGIAGLVEFTPTRRQYLDKVWNTYKEKFGTPMPVDVWNMHLYILPEVNWEGEPNGIANIALGTDPALGMRESGGRRERCTDPLDNIYCFAEHDNLVIFADQIRQMRLWMKEHGQQNKPLIISEYSILYPFEDYDDPNHPTRCFLQDEFGQCFTPARVSNFMTRTFEYMETARDPALGYPLDNYRLVQQWLWFSMYYEGAGSASNLLNRDMTSLTQVGQTLFDHIHRISTYANLFPGSVAHPIAFTSSPTGTTEVSLSATIYNNGNTYVRGPITATFYVDANLTQMIGSAVFPGTVIGCARQGVTLSVTWSGLTAGKHDFWVKVEGDEDTADNVARGFVLVNPDQTFLPLVSR